MAEIVYRQMPAPRDIPQKMPAHRAKIRMQKPQSGGEFSVQIPGGAWGGWSWQKLITALAVENKKIYICRKGGDYNRIVNLMLIADVENRNKKHYVAVKSLLRLLSKQNSKHKEAQHFCTNCLNGFESEIIRDEHYEYCRSKDSVRVEMPTKNPIVKHADGQYQFKVPFVIYADFESMLVPVSGALPHPEMSSTRGIKVHQPSGWCMYSKFA